MNRHDDAGQGVARPARRAFTFRDLLVLLATLAAVALALRLGFWQLDRAAQKTALQAALAGRESLPAIDASRLPSTVAEAEALHYRRVELRGRWLAERTVFLDNRQMDGKAGFYVVTPLLIDGTAQAILVQRGWMARNFAERTALAEVPTPAGTIGVAGFLAPAPSRMFEFAASASGAIRQNVEIASFAQETGLALRPAVILQRDDAASAAADGLQRHWPAPATDVEKHYGYAFQWFAIAAGIALLHVWYRILRPRRRHT